MGRTVGGKKRGLVLLLLCAIFGSGTCIRAETEEVVKEEDSCSVEIVIPAVQREGVKLYFDLTMEPGEEQSLEVELENHSKEDKMITAEIATAVTNSEGIVDYVSGENRELEGASVFNMSDLATVESPIEISAGESCVVQIQVKMPPDFFEGILAGAIHFYEEESVHTIALLLRNSETPITPVLELSGVYSEYKDGEQRLFANLHNTQGAYITGMKMHTEIRKQGEEEILDEVEENQLQMAPNSNFDYQVPLNAELETGNYLLTMDVQSSEDIWSFEKEFTVKEAVSETTEKDLKTKTQTEEKDLNAEAETEAEYETTKESNRKKASPVWKYVLAGIAVVAGGILLFVWYRRRAAYQEARRRAIEAAVLSLLREF